MNAEEVQLYYQIGQHARRDMPYASDQREAFDMALLRMIAFAPQPNTPMALPAGSNSASNADSASAPARKRLIWQVASANVKATANDASRSTEPAANQRNRRSCTCGKKK